MNVMTKHEHMSAIIMQNVKIHMARIIVVVWMDFMEMELFVKTLTNVRYL